LIRTPQTGQEMRRLGKTKCRGKKKDPVFFFLTSKGSGGAVGGGGAGKAVNVRKAEALGTPPGKGKRLNEKKRHPTLNGNGRQGEKKDPSEGSAFVKRESGLEPKLGSTFQRKTQNRGASWPGSQIAGVPIRRTGERELEEGHAFP